ncbi:MAG: response regulator [Asgard group archaeon]|nr:response regulator [Asgard group archaeon]
MNKNTENLKIMIVEDDPLILQLYEQILSQKGYHVIAVASDGAEAVEIYHELPEKPDLIILDFRLPKKNGLEVSKEILARNSTIDILMITGDPLIDQKAIIGPKMSFITKPADIQDILHEISIIDSI